MKKGFTTRVLHTDFLKKDPFGSIRMPIYETAAFEFDTSEDIANAFQGKVKAPAYTRTGNPTIDYLEETMKSITEANAVIATASGMAAITNAILAICNSGDNIVASSYLFGNTFSLFNTTLKSFGITTKFVDIDDIKAVEKAIDSNTRALFLETISNPQLQVPDIKTLAELVNKKGILLIVDTTLTPANIFNAKELKVDIEVTSCTKYYSGGGTSIGGLILEYGSYDWNKNPKVSPWVAKFNTNAFYAYVKKEIFRNFGGCLSPHNAFLQTLALETLTLRVDKTCENAFALASWMEEDKHIKRVNYPGLSGSKWHKNAKKIFNGRYGGLITIELDNEEDCYRFLDKLKIIKRATNMNDNRSLIIHPWSTIYSEFSDSIKLEQQISKGLMRLSVGIEDLEDLKEDISTALKAL